MSFFTWSAHQEGTTLSTKSVPMRMMPAKHNKTGRRSNNSVFSAEKTRLTGDD